MSQKELLNKILNDALKMLREKLPAKLSYHNYEHTKDVLKAVERIAVAEKVTDDEMMLLKLAAAFHDTGYIYLREKHEERSCEIARDIFTANGIDSTISEKVCELIMATKVPQRPKDRLGEILCDADLDYLGRDDYFRISERVYDEFKFFGVVSDNKAWKEMQIHFLESHRYFTETANKTRKEGKKENLEKIRASN